MKKSLRKTRCWACKSLDVIRWGIQQGKQRFKCKTCGILFSSENRGVTQTNERIWFERWVVERRTIESLSRESGIEERTLRRKFSVYLSQNPLWVIPSRKVVNLVLDGTYFHNKLCLFIYRENELKDTILYRLTDGELTDEIYEDLVNIMRLGLVIQSITCDGHKSILRAIRKANKWIKIENIGVEHKVQPIIIQRCMVHVQRSCLTYLKKEHQSLAGRRLRSIAMTICKIDTLSKKQLFIDALAFWFDENRDYIMQLSRSDTGRQWRTHKALYSAYRAIKSAMPNMFRYLDNSQIPSTTNCLEGYFSQLKSVIGNHRGLSKEHFEGFIRWYIYFNTKS